MDRFVAALAIVLVSASFVVAETFTGSCGKGISYSFDNSTGVFTVSGSGDMTEPCDFTKIQTVKKIVIGESVTSVCASAFEFWSKVTSIDFGGVKTIGDKAFSRLLSLEELTISDTVTSIGTRAFSDCPLNKSVVIGKNVETIGFQAFWRSKLTSIVIPDSVKTIGDETFMMCSDLKSVTFGTGVKTISMGLFRMCDSLTIVNMSRSIKTIEKDAFIMCSSLEYVVIPSSVTEIEGSAFTFCDKLKTVAYLGSKNPDYSSSPRVFFSTDKLERVCVLPNYNSSQFCELTNLVNIAECDVPLPASSSSAARMALSAVVAVAMMFVLLF